MTGLRARAPGVDVEGARLEDVEGALAEAQGNDGTQELMRRPALRIATVWSWTSTL